LSSAVDYINLMQGNSVDNLFAFLEFTLRALHKSERKIEQFIDKNNSAIF
jgi:hypothetical protein